MINFWVAQFFGFVALVILIISFQRNSKFFLLKYQIFSSLLYSIQYVFLGAFTGCLMNLSCMIRNIIFNNYKKVPLYWLIIVLFLMILFSIFTFDGFISLLPMFAVVFYSIALWNGNLKIIRIIEMVSCILFIIYNINVSAYTGLVATLIEFFGAFFAFLKFDLFGYSNK